MGWLAGFLEMIWAVLVEAWPTTIIPANNVGVRFTLGRPPKVLAPGVRRSLPIIDDVDIINPLPQWVDLPEQVVTTTDHESLIVSGAIYYEIDDPYKLYMAVQDADDSLIAVAQAKLAEHIATREYLGITIQGIIKAVKRPLRREAAKWGIRILDMSINQLANTKVHWIGGASPTLGLFD